MNNRPTGDWMSVAPKDMLGREFALGDIYVKACTSGRAVNIQLCKVTRIENGKIYGDESKVAINYPGRCLIVTGIVRDRVNE